MEDAAGGSKGGSVRGFTVQKTGDAQCCLIGFPSVGKSSLLNAITNTKTKVSEIEFTTLEAVPGTFTHKDVTINLVDLPGIIEGASDARGRGRAVLGAARTADLIIIMVDGTKPISVVRKLTSELESFGIRLNKKPRDIQITRAAGGVSITTTCELKRTTEEEIIATMREIKANNMNILIRDPMTTVDDIIDALPNSSVVYIPVMFVVNKCDALSQEELELFMQLPNWIPISAAAGWGLTQLKDAIVNRLDLMRIFTKPPGAPVDTNEPFIIKRNASISDLAKKIHKSLFDNLDHALVWGTSTKFMGQRCGKEHVLDDEDVIQLVTKK